MLGYIIIDEEGEEEIRLHGKEYSELLQNLIIKIFVKIILQKIFLKLEISGIRSRV